MVGKMIDDLVVSQSDARLEIEDFAHIRDGRPIDIPILVVVREDPLPRLDDVQQTLPLQIRPKSNMISSRTVRSAHSGDVGAAQ